MQFPATTQKRLAGGTVAGLLALVTTSPAFAGDELEHKTATPIKHVVVIFQENVSFDHYFATYPVAANKPGEPHFHARRPRLLLLVISPYAKRNFVDGTLTDQSSILRFIEDNWGVGRIGGGSSDDSAGSLLNMFDFSHPRDHRLFVDPSTGQPTHRDGDRDDD